MQEGKIDVRIARSFAEVETLREPWKRWPGHRDSDVDYYLMIVQSYPEAVRPHVIALSRNGEPEAILVGRFEIKRLAFPVGYLRPFRPWARCLTFVYDAIHGNPSLGNTQVLLQEVMNNLKRGEADVAMLEYVPLESPLYKLALELPGILSRDVPPAPQEHYVMELTGCVDDVYSRMSHDRRKNIRRKLKKFASSCGGQVRIVCCRTESELDILFRDAEQIAAKTYQRGLGTGFADTDLVRERLGLAARRGWLRSYLLYVDDQPCAFWVGMLYGETFLGEYIGYDPKFSQFSPGMFLMMRVIEGFCNRAGGDLVKKIDFGLGHAEYKAALSNQSWLEAPIYIFSPTLKGLTLKLMRATTRAVNGTVRKMLGSTQLLRRLKKAWRNRLAGKAKAIPGTAKMST